MSEWWARSSAVYERCAMHPRDRFSTTCSHSPVTAASHSCKSEMLSLWWGWWGVKTASLSESGVRYTPPQGGQHTHCVGAAAAQNGAFSDAKNYPGSFPEENNVPRRARMIFHKPQNALKTTGCKRAANRRMVPGICWHVSSPRSRRRSGAGR